MEQTTIEQTNTTEPRTINTGASRTGRTTTANTVVNQTVEAPQTIETRGQTTTQVNNSRRRTIVENQVINDTETVIEELNKLQLEEKQYKNRLNHNNKL